MKSDIRCVKSRALIQYVEARNPDQLPMLWRFCESEAGEEGPERFFSNPDNKMSLDLCTMLMDLAKKATSDEMAAFKAAYRFGRSEHREREAGFFCSPFGLMKDLLREAQKSDGLPGKHIEFVSFSETNVIVRVHWPKELNLTRDFCLFEQGLYQALPMEHGLPPARLWERTCFFEGGPYCEYEIWWSRKETIKKPSFKWYFSRKEKSITAATVVAIADRVETRADTPGHQDQSELESSQAPSSTTSDTATSVHLESPGPSSALDTTTEGGPEEAALAPEETPAPLPQNAGNEDSKRVEAEGGCRLPAMSSRPRSTQNEHPFFNPEPKPPEESAERQRPKTPEEPLPAGEKIDVGRLEEVTERLGHLFKGLGRMVALMLSETNIGHPQAEHLKRIEDMLWMGDALRRELLSVLETAVGQSTACEGTWSPQRPPVTKETAIAGATILLVEDLEPFRDAGREMLGTLGYDVLVATDGQEALEIFRDKGDQIDLVMMDMSIAVAKVKEMKDIKPAVKVFFSIAGHTEEAQKIVRALGCEGLIQKPFSIHDLHLHLQGILTREQR